jgi:hypothetical protein
VCVCVCVRCTQEREREERAPHTYPGGGDVVLGLDLVGDGGEGDPHERVGCIAQAEAQQHRPPPLVHLCAHHTERQFFFYFFLC